MQKCLVADLPGYNDELWNDSLSINMQENFLYTEDTSADLFVYIDQNKNLVFNKYPPSFDKIECQFVSFLKPVEANLGQQTFQDFKALVTTASVEEDNLQSLIDTMDQQFLPELLMEVSWGEGDKKEFLAQLHKFMATAVECCFARRGETRL